MNSYFVAIPVALVILTLVFPPLVVKSMNMPEGDSPNPTTPNTAEGQNKLPLSTTLARDKDGNIVISLENRKILIQELVPKDASEKEKQAAEGYITGYMLAMRGSPKVTEEYIKQYSDEILDSETPVSTRVGFLLGVQDALEVQDVYKKLIKDTLEGLGVQGVDQLPQLKANPPPMILPKPNPGPPT